MSQLTHLSVSANKLRYLPAEIGNLKKLTHLLLADNCLESLPVTLTQCSQLEVLKLALNYLGQVDLADFALQLPNLHTLVASPQINVRRKGDLPFLD
jgi:Leucine-rich repeat (LRR) protein